MDQIQKAKLIEIYKRYGFSLRKDTKEVLVFTLKTGYFDNAEILFTSSSEDAQAFFEEFTAAGYACKTRRATTPEEAERDLFLGFFSVESTHQRSLEEYERFSAALVAPYGPTARYEYIKAPYQINGKDGDRSPPEEVLCRMSEPGPVLFLIEAAAGFGKTCTALEVVRLLAHNKTQLPLYAELSRNRQARIFRYILLDEIDRSFPLLSSSLVQAEIKNGRVATILDGFDELLRKNEESGEFENQEPMLETVSELLTGNAKVIITTRRTVLFDGDEFHQWLDRHADAFRVVRMRIQEPRVDHWLKPDRLKALKDTGLQIESMANPVLLSYLRCIDDQKFLDAVGRPESIVESYFTYMLERERDRQDLRMTVGMQSQVLIALAKDMMDVGYTAEAREYIVNFLLSKLSKEIDEARLQYAASERPGREEIANKLASHALLDRSANDPNKISFINEFSLGEYAASNMLTGDWMDDDMRFIEPAVRSYAPRTVASRIKLFFGLRDVLPYLETGDQLEISAALRNSLPDDLREGNVDGISFEAIEIGGSPISNFLFNECIFSNCTIHPSALDEVTFLNCKFYDCTVEREASKGPIHVLGGDSTSDIQVALDMLPASVSGGFASSPDRLADQHVLQKMWPLGEPVTTKPSRPIFRPLKHLVVPSGTLSSADLFRSVTRLLKAGILMTMPKSGLVALDQSRISDVLGYFDE